MPKKKDSLKAIVTTLIAWIGQANGSPLNPAHVTALLDRIYKLP